MRTFKVEINYMIISIGKFLSLINVLLQIKPNEKCVSKSSHSTKWMRTFIS